MWERGWRDRVWSDLDRVWDLIIIGGGITGAGILREATRAGLRALLVERSDFGSGTSSRSSKLVHGGFRYLQHGQLKLIMQSVRERERLLKEGRGLVIPLGFLLANYRGDWPPAWLYGAGLMVYDLLAFKWGHRHYDAFDIKELCPLINDAGLLGGYRFFDAQTDDARLVLRVLREGVRGGGTAINYACVTGLLKSSGQVCGVVLEDQAPDGQGRAMEIQAALVINATGAWSDDLRSQVGGRSRLRRLRGSHLIFPASRLPLTRSVSMQQPKDGRFVFAFPWEGVTLVGTTDVDHKQALQNDTEISLDEAEYLLEAVQRTFPDQELSLADVQATFSGVRPVIDTGKSRPSDESRDHIIWCENGLLTVTGGKLTTFRLMAHDALRAACRRLPGGRKFDPNWRVLDPPPPDAALENETISLIPSTRQRLLGRFGSEALQLIHEAQPGEMEKIHGTPALWAELRWAARREAVVHLEDLLLRRVRLGLLLPNGASPLLDSIRTKVQDELGWDASRWEKEVANYTKLWKRCYYLNT